MEKPVRRVRRNDDAWTTQDNTIKIKGEMSRKNYNTNHEQKSKKKKTVAHIAVKWSHTFFAAHTYHMEMKR